MPTRRECLIGAASTLTGLTLGARFASALAAAGEAGIKVGMCDWSLRHQDVSAFEWARRIGLDGVQVSIGQPADKLRLRQAPVQKEYLEASRKTGVAIPSVAMGVLNEVPLMSEPRAAVWVADTIEVTKNLAAGCILLAFFGKGELKEENKADMQRVIDVLAELAPRAEKAGVILGVESYLSAEAHLKILDAVKSKAVQVYYDVYNADHAGHDYLKEIRLIGGERICQVHFKNGPKLLEAGPINWTAVVATLKEVKYPGWIVLETSSPHDLVTDTRANAQYVRKLFRGTR
jgi:L-ribulose-5-phosphate 3-epimerase